MRVVLQRVSEASVKVAGETVGSIGRGYMALVGFASSDGDAEIEAIASKIVNLRVFPDENNRFNKSLIDVDGEILAVSQITLYADCRKGRRPSFTDAALPEQGRELFDRFIGKLKGFPIKNIQTGTFQAMMEVSLVNSGPVTIYLDSKDFVK